MNAHVLVPLKRLDRAKSRLARLLTPDRRARLMLDLLDNVVAVVRAAGIQRITLVTPERIAHDSADTWHDGGLPWNDALARAAEEVVATEVVAVVSADIPFLRPSDVRALLERTPGRGIAVGRAHDGGTNAVALRPRGVMPTLFGEPESARLHAEAAAARRLGCVVLDLPGLAFDVDTPEDFERMRREREGRGVSTLPGVVNSRGGQAWPVRT